jgi:hypothetical protein
LDPRSKKVQLLNSGEDGRLLIVALNYKLKFLVTNKQINIFISDPLPYGIELILNLMPQ